MGLWQELLYVIRKSDRRRAERELDEEIRAHIEIEVEQNIESGMTEQEARYAAQRTFGNVSLAKEDSRTIWGLRYLEVLWQDLHYGVRMLINRPTFTVFAIIALSLGIGINSAIFSVVNAVLLRPLPFSDPDRLVQLREMSQKVGEPVPVSPPNFIDWKTQSSTFEQIAAYHGQGFTLTGVDEAERVLGVRVSSDFLPLLGIKPILGRNFSAEEDRAGKEQVLILTHSFWQRRFGSDPGIIGKDLILNGQNFTVIGIMPPGFNYPRDETLAFWTPLAPDSNPSRGSHYLTVIARLKSNVTSAQAQREMDVIAKRLEERYRNTNTGNGVIISSLHEQTVGEIRPTLLVLFGVVLLVLLIACANVANLQLVRTLPRQREIAIRMALGADRLRVIRQLLTENILLSVIGGMLGLLLALWGVELLLALGPENIPRLKEINIDYRVFGFTFALSVITGIVFGLAPAMQTFKINLNDQLKEGGRSMADGSQKHFRSTLVVFEIAISLVLLIGAGLMIKSFGYLIGTDPGFKSNNLLTMTIFLPKAKYPENRRVADFFSQVLQKGESVPGIDSIGLTSQIPLNGTEWTNSFDIEGRPPLAPGKDNFSDLRWISPGYFKTMGIPFIKGRQFTDRDVAEAPGVVIINQSMARKFFPDEDPIGKRLTIAYNHNISVEIVGVVGDIRPGVDSEPAPEMYLSYLQTPVRALYLVVRTSVEPTAIVATIRKQVSSIDKEQPISNIRSMDQVFASSIAQRRFNTLLFGIFAAMALILAAIGIYGVISFFVTQRRHEIGIRMALGAQRIDVIKLVMRQGIVLSLIGVAIGICAALVFTRVLSSLLFGITATDPIIFLVIPTILVGVALSASYIPAWRATRIDPMIAIRYE
jgi:putative ABC transport system permease protein